MKISVISPVKNEADFIGYSAMAVLPFIHEILYGVANCSDGTLELLNHIKKKYAGEKLKIFHDEPVWEFSPMDMAAYNASYNALIERSTGDAVWFLHPDMVVTNPEAIAHVDGDALAFFTHVDSYARDMNTQILSGRTKRWKNIHRNQFGLHYHGGYGSLNEDFYHKDITGVSYRHYGDDFAEYPFEVGDSKIRVNHYCELKSYSRRLEKMKRCLKTQQPTFTDERIEELAMNHPRVTLENGAGIFGRFEFGPSTQPEPLVFQKYGDEFKRFGKQLTTA